MLRWIGRILSVLVLLALVAVGLVAMMPADRVAQIAADQLRVMTGRDVTVSGDVSVTVWPVLGATVGGLEIANADWARQGPMLTARDATIRLDAAALLRGEIRITHIGAVSPTIRLESRSDGRASWRLADPAGSAQVGTETAPGRAPPVSVERVAITDATLIHDAEGADLLQYSGIDLTLAWPDRDGPARIEAVVRPAGAPVSIEAQVDRFAAFLSGASQPVEVSLDAASGTARFTGEAALDGSASGALSVTSTDTNGLLRSLGLPGAELPAGLGRVLELTADLRLTPDRHLVLRDLQADLGAGNRVRGSAEVSFPDVPQITAQLAAGALDLSGLTRAEAGSGPARGEGAPAAGGWPTTPIDASGLAAFNGEISLTADSIDLGAAELGPSQVVITNDNARLVVSLIEVAVHDGQVTGEFVLNNRNGLSVGGRLTGRSLQLQGLLDDMAGVTRLTGSAGTELEFLGAGQSVDAIMRSLRGRGSLSVARGTIEGIDLDRLMRSGDAGPGTTVFDSLTASYVLEGGNLHNDDLLMLLPGAEARGAGRVGIGARDIDYLFTPKVLRVNEGRGLAIPVRIRGPWSDPNIEPDLAAAVDLNFEEERRAAEREIRQNVENRVARELGVTPEEGQSVEDAIEKKLEREIGNGLKRLFD